MSRFLETLAIENGQIRNAAYHLARIRSTQLVHFGEENAQAILDSVRIAVEWPAEKSKCSIQYDTKLIQSYVSVYAVRKHFRFDLVETPLDYSYKFADRSALNRLKSNFLDEVILVKNGCLTDCTYANLAFFGDGKWFTPDTPLLNGTARQRLIRESVLEETRITTKDLNKFRYFKLINALLDWEESPVYLVNDAIAFPNAV